jgi:hypothetical protein
MNQIISGLGIRHSLFLASVYGTILPRSGD